MKKKPVAIKLDPELAEQLRELSKTSEVPAARLLARAVREFLASVSDRLPARLPARR